MKLKDFASKARRSIDRRVLLTSIVVLVMFAFTVAAATNLALVAEFDTANDFEGGEFVDTVIDDNGVAPEELLESRAYTDGETYSHGSASRMGFYFTVHNESKIILTADPEAETEDYHIREQGTGDLIKTVENVGPGETFEATVEPGDYYVYATTDWEPRFSETYPYTLEDVEVTAGLYQNSESDDTFHMFSEVSVVKSLAPSSSYTSPSVEITDPHEIQIDYNSIDGQTGIELQYHDGSGWNTLDTQDKSGDDGTSTLTVSDPEASELWRVVVNFNDTDEAIQDTLRIDAIRFYMENDAPDLSNPSPAGGELVTETPVELTIDVSDPDFETTQGDEVSVTFYDASDDSVIGSDTLTSNGTASVQWDSPVAGENNWYVVAEDSYGGSTTSTTNTFETPNEIRIFNESAPNELVSDTEVTIEFYFEDGSETIIERETIDGTVDMTGLPVDRPFIVVAEGDGYLPRRIFVEDLTTRQDVYLLPDSAEFVESTFELEDLSGAYATDETVLIIQRNLNGSWETVQGDFFGATGEWTAQLAYNKRHRLIVKNIETGKERSVGTFTPTTSDRHTIRVSMEEDIQLLDSGAIVSVSPSARSLPAESSATFLVELAAVDELVEWSVEATWSNSTTSEQLVNVTNEGPTGGEVNPTVDLTDKSDGNLMVSVAWETVPGESGSYQVEFAVRELFDDTYALLPTIQRGVGQLAPENVGTVTTMLAVIFTVIITAAAGQHLRLSSEILGLVAILSFSGFWALGWLNWGLLFAAGVAWIAGMGVRRGL